MVFGVDRRAFLIAALALSACATTPPVVKPGGPFLELEPLYRADARREGLIIRVGSNGCTAKEDFTFYLERRGEAVSLAFARKRIDTCKSFAMGSTELTFTWAELGLPPQAPVFLLNPLVAWTGPGG